MKNIKYIRITGIVLLLLLVVVFTFFFWYKSELSWQDVWNFSSESTALAALLLIGIYCLKTIAWAIPLNVLYLGAGYLFSTGPAIIMTYLGLITELTLGFYLGRYLGTRHVRTTMEKRKYAKWFMEAAAKNGVMSCFLIRVLPGPPADVVNMFFGTLNIRYVPFLFFSLLGLTPGMLSVIFIGRAAANPLSPEFLLPFFIRMIIAACSLAGYFMVKKKQSVNNDKTT